MGTLDLFRRGIPSNQLLELGSAGAASILIKRHLLLPTPRIRVRTGFEKIPYTRIQDIRAGQVGQIRGRGCMEAHLHTPQPGSAKP